jgi:hypothetical protein
MLPPPTNHAPCTGSLIKEHTTLPPPPDPTEKNYWKERKSFTNPLKSETTLIERSSNISRICNIIP